MYEKLLTAMQACIDNGDTECAHGDADNLLIDTALAAADGELTKSQVKEIIALYEAVEKWYA